MMLTKMVINTVANNLAKHFKLDKVMAYVFDDNELDVKAKKLESRILVLERISNELDLHSRIEKLESMAHPKKDFVVCKQCEKQIEEL